MEKTRISGLEGFLNIRKPYGWTSHDVVGLVRKLTGIRRVGHAGTLDPAAAGVLVVALGRATRLIDYLSGQDKSYCADIVLGASTETDDAEGTVLLSRDPARVDLAGITRSLSRFVGRIEQIPPQYSAVKLGGRKAYDVARRGGTSDLAARTVTLHGLAVVAWEPPTVSVVVRCSKGTYIRSLARDLGADLDVGGHLGALVRITSGGFLLEDSATVEELRLAAEFGYLDRLVWPADTAVLHLPALIVTAKGATGMAGGRQWAATADTEGSWARVYSEDGEFVGVAERLEEHWQPRLVMSEAS